MLDKFKKYLRECLKVEPGDTILLAVSGGIDSVVMAELFHRAEIPFAIAHCNFGLRGEESDEDARFVEELAKRYRARFFTARFDARGYAETEGISVQMAAREQRYKWFEELRQQEKFDYIAVAHHLDDQVETFFINLLRGTGIHGLHGILPRQEHIIRPLMFAYRKDIEEFVKEARVKFRFDSSNASFKYLRNRIRHELMPILESMNPDFLSVMNDNIFRIRDAELIFNRTIDGLRGEIMKETKGKWYLSLEKLRQHHPVRTVAFELLAPFGFNIQTVRDILKNVEGASGQQYFSKEYRLTQDRKQLIISKIKREDTALGIIHISETDTLLTSPLHIEMTHHAYDKSFRIDGSPSVASLDAGKITYPLVLRRWKPGDKFKPFGMKQMKKVSDFLTDAKISRDKKDETFVLLSGSSIIWVIGQRPDDRFRITPRTKSILRLSVKD